MASISISLLDLNGKTIETWPLTEKKTYRIGRSKGNDVLIESSWVSRQHAMLQIEENGTVNVVDMGSANGTTVNDRRVYAPTALHSGDTIKIGGKSILLFSQETPAKTNYDLEFADEQTVAFISKAWITILICDIRRFTTLSEQIGAQQTSDIIKIWSRQANDIVKRYQGQVDKFIGDAVMAVWTERQSKRNTFNLALQCAVNLAEMTSELGDKIGDLPWKLSVGGAINTGEAAIGNIGVDGNRDYTVIGDTVNIAFRLEDLTEKVGKDFLIGNDAAALIDTKLLNTYFSPYQYQLKGKTSPVTAYGCTLVQLQQYLINSPVSG